MHSSKPSIRNNLSLSLCSKQMDHDRFETIHRAFGTSDRPQEVQDFIEFLKTKSRKENSTKQ